MPLDNQVDQATGIAELSLPHTTIMAATPQSECPEGDMASLQRPKKLPTGLVDWGSIDGKLSHCQIGVATTRGVMAQKTPASQ
jgi:hypothetical protein